MRETHAAFNYSSLKFGISKTPVDRDVVILLPDG